ncbi:MAG TPA: hypothetical protein PK954_11800 [Anaerolineales bacterium]|nr:hypothetical protein [Anaerolineales bacterium]
MNIPSNTPPAPSYGSSGGGTNSMALISLISAGVTWILGWLGGCGLSALLGPFALGCSGIGLISTVVTGHMGMGQTGAGSSESGSRWMAITGLALNYLSVLLMVLGICFMILVFGGALAFLGLNAEEFQQMLTPMP